MNELQGLNLINSTGQYKGVIEENFYDPIYNYHTIHYHEPNGKYSVVSMDKIEFNRYSSYAKIKSDRYNIIKNRNIKHIYHFSPIENTDSILIHGFCSRKLCELMHMNNVITDPNRFDGEFDKISASISFPNYKMRYSLEKQKGYNLIIYDISPKILLSKLDIQFYYTNAANAIFRNIDKRTLTTNEAFEGMFRANNREPDLEKKYTTDPQAEILVNTHIPNLFINEVISNTYNQDIKKLCYRRNLSYNVDSTVYGPRCDYRRW